MSEEKTILWPGKSGEQYKYWIHPIGTEFKDISGNYIFAKETSPGKWWPVYIGQTNSLSTRLAHHEKEACAKSNGATHIHAHTSGNEATRLAEEKDLIVNWKPVCNEQHT
ncbi:hypothetical protein [Aeromonas caviae]|uniref:hypothetical protein n=1 Tax=Aeromonas caviae TaxID=648 RepID=UPI002B4992EB|nr:hypothetical protein [Aeromonas caviae]